MIGQKQRMRQARATALIASGIAPTPAMRIAGYAASTARNPKENLLDKPTVKPILDQYRNELKKQGITLPYIAAKAKQFLEAKKKDPEDYFIQMKALDTLSGLFGLKEEKYPAIIKGELVPLEEFEEREGILSAEIS